MVKKNYPPFYLSLPATVAPAAEIPAAPTRISAHTILGPIVPTDVPFLIENRKSYNFRVFLALKKTYN